MTQFSQTIDNDIDLGDLRYLSKHITKTINLPEFVESETGQTVVWSVPEVSAKCCCPLHEESIPSFNITWLNDEIWVYHCFGCGAKGNIIHFCRDFHGLRNKLEAIHYICHKYNIQNAGDLILEGIKQVSVKIDKQRKLENENILASNQCRMLLIKNFELHHKWVSKAYKKLDEALDKDDMKEVIKISYEAAKRSNAKEKK